MMHSPSEIDAMRRSNGCPQNILPILEGRERLQWANDRHRELATKLWANMKPGSVTLLVGNVGTGKTVMSCLLADRFWRERAHPATERPLLNWRYYRQDRWLARVSQERFADLNPQLPTARSEAENASVLVLDELSPSAIDGGARGFELEAIESLLDTRQNSGRPTVVCSNADLDTLAQDLPKIVDRAIGLGAIADFDWQSMRHLDRGA